MPPPIAAPAAPAEVPVALAVVATTFPANSIPAGITNNHSAAPIRKPRAKTLESVRAPFCITYAEIAQPPKNVPNTNAEDGAEAPPSDTNAAKK